MTHFSPQPKPTSTSRLYLGISLSPREIGHALTTGEDLVRYGVVNVRKADTEDGKVRRLEAQMLRYLDAHDLSGVIIVRAAKQVAVHPLVIRVRTWLEAVLRDRQISVCFVDRLAAGRILEVDDSGPETHRHLFARLGVRFPELRHLISPGGPAPYDAGALGLRPRTPLPSARERYWLNMFLALSAVTQHIDGKIMSETTA